MTVRDGCVPAGTRAALCVLPAGPALHPSGLPELGREGGKRSFIPRADRAAPSSHSLRSQESQGSFVPSV